MDRSRLSRFALAVWAVVLLVVCVKPLLKPVSGTVYVTYETAGEEFAAGRPLYNVPHPHTDNFRYSPLVAAGFVPFSLLPLSVGGALWRVFGVAVFVSGAAAWARRVCPDVPLGGFFLALLLLSLQSLNNGQANTHITGLMLWAALLALRDRWTAAAVLIGAAALFKGYPLALGGLFVLLAPVRFGLPLVATLAAGLALPYALQSAEYVTAQYQFWWQNIAGDDRTARPLWAGYQDLHLLLRLVGVEVARVPLLAIQAGAGLLLAAVVLGYRVRGASAPALVPVAFTLGACWMVLFGPAVETSTFVVLAPVLARELLDAAGRPRWAKAAAGAGSLLFGIAIVALMFPHAIHRPVIALGVFPLGALLVSLAALGRVLAAPHSTVEAPPAARDEDRGLARAA